MKYERKKFIESGISHTDLFFPDGSNPNDEIIASFLQTCENHFKNPGSGAIAVHCKAGLGRTGTLIGIFAMKHYQIPAEVFIGWSRIARPGSVLGPQQFFLGQKESDYIHTPHSYKKSMSLRDKEMSPIDKIKASRGEDNQGNYLVNAKERHSEKKQRRDS